MRIASIALGVLGGLNGLVIAWFLLAITMMAGGGNPSLAQVYLGIVAALVVASVLCLVAGLLNPQRPMSLKLSLASGAIWIVCAIVVVIMTQVLVPSDKANLVEALKFAGFIALPSVFPFANAVLISRQT